MYEELSCRRKKGSVGLGFGFGLWFALRLELTLCITITTNVTVVARRAVGHPTAHAPGRRRAECPHIKLAGPQLEVILCLLLNAMLRHSYVLTDFRFGIIEPLLKFNK